MPVTKEWSPLEDERPNIRDIFAMNEHSSPIFQSNEEVAAYLGINPVKYKPRQHYPLALAKWRYACADAMLKYKGMENA